MAITADGYWLKMDANKYYTTYSWNSKTEEEKQEIISKIITKTNSIFGYKPAQSRYKIFYSHLSWLYHSRLYQLLENGADLDDIRLFFKYNKNWIWNDCSSYYSYPPIAFSDFLANRSLSKYIQKASKEIDYESNKNRNNNRKQ